MSRPKLLDDFELLLYRHLCKICGSKYYVCPQYNLEQSPTTGSKAVFFICSTKTSRVELAVAATTNTNDKTLREKLAKHDILLHLVRKNNLSDADVIGKIKVGFTAKPI